MTTLIIAEAGVNHNGDIEVAKQLIAAAKAAGADIVKFQTFKTAKLVTKAAEKATYQKGTTDADESQYAMISKLELSRKDYEVLIEECGRQSIGFSPRPSTLTASTCWSIWVLIKSRFRPAS
jgi:N,N'-diacetyllegionaminate synthase